MPASTLSVFTWACAIAFTCSGLAMITRRTNGDSTRETAMQLPVASMTTSSVDKDSCLSLRARSASCRPGRRVEARRPPNHHLAEGSVDVDADHPSHARLPVTANGGSGGRHDTYGFALSAQPGNRRGGQLLTRALSSSNRSACPHLRAPGASVPDGRTIRRDPRSQPDFGAALSYRL